MLLLDKSVCTPDAQCNAKMCALAAARRWLCWFSLHQRIKSLQRLPEFDLALFDRFMRNVRMYCFGALDEGLL